VLALEQRIAAVVCDVLGERHAEVERLVAETVDAQSSASYRRSLMPRSRSGSTA
jgi:hypothetical protein